MFALLKGIDNEAIGISDQNENVYQSKGVPFTFQRSRYFSNYLVHLLVYCTSSLYNANRGTRLPLKG